jgi:hypothetical protein
MSGCAPRVRFTAHDPVPASAQRTAPEGIRLFATKNPECAYAEIGRLTVKSPYLGGRWNAVVDAARRRAAEVGGDAIIRVQEGVTVTGATIVGNEVYPNRDDVITGLVVRFTKEDCRT